MATYDMSPLDASERIPMRVHITNETLSIDEIKMISIATGCSISELKFEIEKALSIETRHQQTLSIQSTDSDGDEIVQLKDEEMKLSDYNVNQSTIIHLQLSDDCNWDESQIKLDMAVSSSSPTSKTQQNAINNNSDNGNIRSIPVDETIHFLTKHSKIQCRILLIVFVKLFNMVLLYLYSLRLYIAFVI